MKILQIFSFLAKTSKKFWNSLTSLFMGHCLGVSGLNCLENPLTESIMMRQIDLFKSIKLKLNASTNESIVTFMEKKKKPRSGSKR